MPDASHNKTENATPALTLRLGPAALYAGMIVAAIALFLVIDAYGTRLTSPAASLPAAATPASLIVRADPVVHVLIALTAVLIAGRILAVLFRFVGQPPVIGEVVGGILLGPSFLGRVWPEGAAFILPPSVAPNLGMIAQLGVVLYMFLVGLELNPNMLRHRAHATIAISHASILAPFVLGSVLALYLYPRLSSSDVTFTSFALFMGVAMSITAFPVLARILTDRQMHKTQLGIIALGCAATDDVTAWCLLAFVVGVAQAKLGGAFVVLGLTVAYIGFMFFIVRPMVHKLVTKIDETRLTPNMVAAVFAALLTSALITEWIGIHAVFGAFLLGAIIPHDSAISRVFTHKLEDVVTILLLPAFFAFTGMRTQIGLVSGIDHWLVCGLIILVATVGKFGGAFFSARLTGMSWRDSTAVGLLMNTRGLMELIALNIGLDMKVISPTLFAMMVLMALVTTMATSPLLQLLPSADVREPSRGGAA